MTYRLTIISVLFCTSIALGQNSARAGVVQTDTRIVLQTPIDSLTNLLKVAKTNISKLELLSALVDEASKTDLNLAKDYASLGAKLAIKLNDQTWQPKFYEMEGRMHANLSQLDSASYYFDKALKGYIAIDDKKGQASTYFKIGWVHKRNGELEPALKVDLEALKLMESIDDKKGIAGAYNRISEDMERQERTDESLTYALKAIDFSEKNGIKEELVYAYISAGNATIAMYKPKEAYDYYNKAITLATTLDFSKFDLINFKNDRANALKRMGNNKEALVEYEKAYAEAQQINYINATYVIIANLGEVNLLLGNYQEALKYQLKTVELQEQEGDISNLTENYGHVSTIYEKLRNFPLALEFQKKARKMRDSTANRESDKAMSTLMTQFETEKKDQTILTQTTQLAQQKKTQTLYFILAGLMTFILFGLIFYYIKRQRKNQELLVLNTKLNTKNKQNELLLKEIHHRVKNNLELVKSLLALQSAQLEDSASKEAMVASQNRVQSMGIIHQKLYQGENLGSIEMKDYFVNLSEGVLDTFNAEDKVKIEFAMDNLELDVDTAVPIGLIVNELLTNALKYAFPEDGKGNILISLSQSTPETLTLKVADNGVGKILG
ncbi:MAG: histidine kinase dimerization/phosphoacceptor domain -containing protein, partial [Aquaticitalea sp.]